MEGNTGRVKIPSYCWGRALKENQISKKRQKKGSMLQFAGCVLLSLGLLNVLLALKSGAPADYFYFAISGLGAASLFAGLWRSKN